MFYLIEKDDQGMEKTRHNLETGETLSKAQLLQILKASYDNPERFEVVKDMDFIHPSEGIEPKEHRDAGQMILEDYAKEIEEIGYELQKGDFQRIAMALSKAFKETYGVPPREVIRESRNKPGQWTSKKQAYPPAFFDDAKKVILRFCREKRQAAEQAKLRREREEKLGRDEYRKRGDR
jgi:hypothetical protein